jgi:hypothetical protein
LYSFVYYRAALLLGIVWWPTISREVVRIPIKAAAALSRLFSVLLISGSVQAAWVTADLNYVRSVSTRSSLPGLGIGRTV